jgi:hypothetical protein
VKRWILLIFVSIIVAVPLTFLIAWGWIPLWITFLLLMLPGFIIPSIASRRSFAGYVARSCTGRAWINEFPTAGKDEIRQFLGTVKSAFGVRRKHLLKLRPDDAVMDIYRALYPPKWHPGDACDFMEWEIELQERYGLSIEKIWRDEITLGEIFKAIGATAKG